MDGLKRLQETRKENKALLEEVKKMTWIIRWKRREKKKCRIRKMKEIKNRENKIGKNKERKLRRTRRGGSWPRS
jgi:hypothetical protein